MKIMLRNIACKSSKVSPAQKESNSLLKMNKNCTQLCWLCSTTRIGSLKASWQSKHANSTFRKMQTIVRSGSCSYLSVPTKISNLPKILWVILCSSPRTSIGTATSPNKFSKICTKSSNPSSLSSWGWSRNRDLCLNLSDVTPTRSQWVFRCERCVSLTFAFWTTSVATWTSYGLRSTSTWWLSSMHWWTAAKLVISGWITYVFSCILLLAASHSTPARMRIWFGSFWS